MNETKLKKDFIYIRDNTIKEINDILEGYVYDWRIFISSFISSIFGIDEADLLSKDKSILTSRARWMYWYCLYMYCGEGYESISKMDSIDGASFTPSTVANGIFRIKLIIDKDPFYNEKWHIIKSIIADKRSMIRKEQD